MLSAVDLHRTGLEASNAGRHAQARGLLERALVRDPDPDTLARILLSLAHVRAELGSTADGVDLCRQALDLANVRGHVRGLAWSQLGMLEMRSGRGGPALEAFTEALRRLDQSPEPLSTAFNNRGMVHLQRGAVRAAQSDFENAVAIARSDDLSVLRAKATHNLGYTHLLAGDLISALHAMDVARDVLAPLSPTMRAMCDQDRAEVLLAAGMIQDAAVALNGAAAAFGARGLRQRQGEAEYVIARLLLAADPAEAGRVARRAKRRFERRGSEVWALRAEVICLTSDVTQRRWVTSLADRADRLQHDLARHRLRYDASTVALQGGRAALLRGDLDEALVRVRRVSLPNAAPLPIRLLDRDVRAELATARGRPAQALTHVRRGLDILQEWQSSFGSLDLQSAVAGHGRALALRGLSLAVADGRPDVIFEWSERARALASRVASLRPPADPTAAEAMTELRRKQGALESGGDRRLDREVVALREQVRRRSWSDRGSGQLADLVALPDLRAVLGDADGAMVAYVYADGNCHALAVTATSVGVVPLGDVASLRTHLDGLEADLDMAASRLPARMKSAVIAGLRHRLDKLADRLVTPISRFVGDRPVVVVPAGALAGVPWTLLPGFTGRPVTVPRSASLWRLSRQRIVASSSAAFVAGPRVERAGEEVKNASSAWASPVVLSGAEAVAARVKDVASSADVLHIAAHGRHTADNPLFSGLELFDGPWFGYDIAQLERIPQTVILSACELGRSTVRWGEETIGMTVAWLHAGANCVIGSPVLVNDAVACEVLTLVHDHLAGGDQPAVALAKAAAVVAAAQPDAAPAPFVCFGAGW